MFSFWPKKQLEQVAGDLPGGLARGPEWLRVAGSLPEIWRDVWLGKLDDVEFAIGYEREHWKSYADSTGDSRAAELIEGDRLDPLTEHTLTRGLPDRERIHLAMRTEDSPYSLSMKSGRLNKGRRADDPAEYRHAVIIEEIDPANPLLLRVLHEPAIREGIESCRPAVLELLHGNAPFLSTLELRPSFIAWHSRSTERMSSATVRSTLAAMTSVWLAVRSRGLVA